MATGPWHYQQAEMLLEGATLGTHPDGSPRIRPEETEHLTAAQVHATLALAAATALSHGLDASSRHAWTQTATGPAQ